MLHFRLPLFKRFSSRLTTIHVVPEIVSDYCTNVITLDKEEYSSCTSAKHGNYGYSVGFTLPSFSTNVSFTCFSCSSARGFRLYINIVHGKPPR